MQVAIHAGAAFTGEGRLLKALRAHKSVLTEHGVAAFGPRQYKQAFKPTFATSEPQFLTPEETSQVRAGLTSDPSIRRAVFQSNALIADSKAAIQDGQFYPRAGKLMSVLDQALEDIRIDFFFGLRNPGTFIPKLLMSLPDEDRENIIRNTDLSCLNWIGMVDDIRDMAPGVNITLWSNEESPLIWGDILRKMCGLPEDVTLEKEYNFLLSLLDEAGKEKANALLNARPDGEQTGIRYALADILEDHAQPELVEEELELPGWSTDIVDAFSELYEQDLERLESMPEVQLLRP
ncbi:MULTISPECIES: hypothetical protein [unclassified Ruegeria]|uniref:hypothetical protein n=1 Tax=unclassified Ruegeria TaxID=2625375 RepID=UPI0014878ACB|nr:MULTISPECIES: hypothetical protein [unclassified Ruegeria]